MVSVKLCGMADGPTAIVRVEVTGVPATGFTGLALSDAATPDGCPVAASVIASPKSPSAVAVTSLVAVAPPNGSANDVGLADNMKSWSWKLATTLCA